MTLSIDDEDELDRVITHNLAKGDWDISIPAPGPQNFASDEAEDNTDGKEDL